MNRLVGAICLAGFIFGSYSLGLSEDIKRTAVITSFSGTVEVRVVKGNWSAASVGMKLNQGDFMRTKANSWAVVNLDAASSEIGTVEVKENSQMRFTELLENAQENTRGTLLDLALGNILIEAKKLHSEKSKFEVKTPTSLVGVRGTKFSVAVEALE